MKLEELLRIFVGIGSWVYRINLYEVDSKGNTKYITHHHMIDYYIDMNNFKDWFDMTVENCLVAPYGYYDNGIKRGLVDIYVKAEVKMKTNIPEIGKTYAFFDDGKTGLSRRYKAMVLDIIPFNVVEELYPELFAGWKENIEAADFLYAPITDFFIRCSIPRYNNGFVYFVRDKNDGWFSIDYPHGWMSGLLDVDGEYGRKNDIPPVEEWVAGKDHWGD